MANKRGVASAIHRNPAPVPASKTGVTTEVKTSTTSPYFERILSRLKPVVYTPPAYDADGIKKVIDAFNWQSTGKPTEKVLIEMHSRSTAGTLLRHGLENNNDFYLYVVPPAYDAENLKKHLEEESKQKAEHIVVASLNSLLFLDAVLNVPEVKPTTARVVTSHDAHHLCVDSKLESTLLIENKDLFRPKMKIHAIRPDALNIPRFVQRHRKEMHILVLSRRNFSATN